DGEVDIHAAVRRGGDALVEPTLHVEHGVDAERRHGCPLPDGGGDVELPLVIDAMEGRRGEVAGDGFLHRSPSTHQYASSSRAAAITLSRFGSAYASSGGE